MITPNITDDVTVLSYLRYLVSFADERRARNKVTQDDIDRVNREVDVLIKRMESIKLRVAIVEALKESRVDAISTNPTRPRSIIFYVFFFIFLDGCSFYLRLASRSHAIQTSVKNISMLLGAI